MRAYRSAIGTARETPLRGRLRATAAVARAVRRERRVPYLPEERWRELRDARIREVVQYAAETVPHYRDAFRAGGIDPREIRTADDLALLPTVDRAALEADPGRFVSTSARGRDALLFETSGTTGRPLSVRHDRESLLENIAYGEREHAVDAALGIRRLRRTTLSVGYGRHSTATAVRAYYARSVVNPLRPRRVSMSFLDPFEDVVAALDRLQPDVFSGTGSFVDLFFRTLAEQGARVRPPRLVRYRSDRMSPVGRELVETGLGVPVVSNYNAVEAFKIGYQCERRRGFHLHADLCHVVVTGEDGRPAAPGELGEVVISNLVNHGTVLLNYRLGDLARAGSGACECGRTAPLLADLEGTARVVLRLPNGRRLHEGAMGMTVMRWREVLSYQLVQEELGRFTLRLVTADEARYERVAARVAAEVRDVLGRDTVVEPRYADSLEPDRRGAKYASYTIPLPEPAAGG